MPRGDAHRYDSALADMAVYFVKCNKTDIKNDKTAFCLHAAEKIYKQPHLRRCSRAARLAEGEERAAVRRLFQPFTLKTDCSLKLVLLAIFKINAENSEKRLALRADDTADGLFCSGSRRCINRRVGICKKNKPNTLSAGYSAFSASFTLNQNTTPSPRL